MGGICCSVFTSSSIAEFSLLTFRRPVGVQIISSRPFCSRCPVLGLMFWCPCLQIPNVCWTRTHTFIFHWTLQIRKLISLWRGILWCLNIIHRITKSWGYQLKLSFVNSLPVAMQLLLAHFQSCLLSNSLPLWNSLTESWFLPWNEIHILRLICAHSMFSMYNLALCI